MDFHWMSLQFLLSLFPIGGTVLAVGFLWLTRRGKGKAAIDQVATATQNAATSATEEVIATAIDRAINVIQVAGNRIREQEIPTDAVAVEVNVNIAGVVEFKLSADIPRTGDIKEIIVDSHQDSRSSTVESS